MKIAIPTINKEGLEANIADHFGRAPYFTVYDTNSKDLSVIDNTGEHFGGKQSAPVLLIKNQINVLICKGLGRRAVTNLKNDDVEIYITTSSIVNEALSSYNNNELRHATEDEACAGRGHH